jgi:hypothetical protein
MPRLVKGQSGKQLGRLRRTEYWMSAPAFLDRFAAP